MVARRPKTSYARVGSRLIPPRCTNSGNGAAAKVTDRTAAAADAARWRAYSLQAIR